MAHVLSVSAQVVAVDDDQPVKYATHSTLQTDGYQVV